MNKNIYFLSDAHLGSRAIVSSAENEKKLCRFLDEIKEKASAVYLLGDMIDFWFEYHNVVPKGFVRFLGKLAELTDSGVEVHYFTGNHDIWTFGYLEKECGVILHREPLLLHLSGGDGDRNTTFYLAHGDGLGDPDPVFHVLRKIFHTRWLQWLFRNVLPPDWGMELGLRWARASRLKHEPKLDSSLAEHLSLESNSVALQTNGFLGEDKEHLVLYAKDYLKTHPDIDYFIFGHRHIELDLMLSRSQRIVILGDWISKFTYAVWDGSYLSLENYDE